MCTRLDVGIGLLVRNYKCHVSIHKVLLHVFNDSMRLIAARRSCHLCVVRDPLCGSAQGEFSFSLDSFDFVTCV